MSSILQTSQLSIASDFKDYYDIESSPNGIVYKRFAKDCMSRGKALSYLRSIGIKTLELKQVSDFSFLNEKLVVYTDPKKHGGAGKKIMSFEEARDCYSNFLASAYLKESNGITVKYLQIGKKRYSLTFKNENESLELGKLIDIRPYGEEYNYIIGLPIFSIDYICKDGLMVATDFNEVQNLEKIFMNHYISSGEVKKEIIESLLAYNKIERT